MNRRHPAEDSHTHAHDSGASIKARLLAWAEETDTRSRKAWPGMGMIAAGGVIAVLSGMVISRALSARNHGTRLGYRSPGFTSTLLFSVMMMGARKWLIPIATQALQRYGLLRSP